MITSAMAMRQNLKYLVREAFRQIEPQKPPLILSPYMQAMCYSLEQTLRGDIKRLVINVPPRYGKSITAAVAFTAWLLGQDPTLKILVATYNDDLARLHDQHLRHLMESPAYRAAFPNTQIDRKRSRQLELYTTAGGSRMAVTTGGSATGYGGDYIILDDCIKAQDASSDAERLRVEHWFRGTIGTRLNSKKEGVIISIQQRLHERDLAALMLEDGATHLNLPVIAPKYERIPIDGGKFFERKPGDLLAPEHEDRETVELQKRRMGRRNFALQYMQDPTPEGGNIVRPEWFARYDAVLPRSHYFKVIHSWDTAYGTEPGSAYSVCTVWGYLDKRYHLLDVFRDRQEYHELKATVIRMYKKWRPDKVLIEDETAGPMLNAELRSKGPFKPIMCRPQGSKEDRLIGQTGQLEAGMVVLPTEASWLEAYEHELLAAPNGRYWDQVDSTTQFLEYAMRRGRYLDTEYDPVTGRKLSVRRRPRRQQD